MSISKFNSWPSGKLPPEWQRQELNQLREAGYEWSDPRDVVDLFERKVAEFAGSKYAVTTDCCSHGMFLSLKYLQATGTITIPDRTYVSCAFQIMHAGCDVAFEDVEWSGIYQLKPLNVWDGATRWRRGMYAGGLHVCSFQIKKRVPIGRGGMILTDDAEAYRWLKKACYDGRDLAMPQWEDDYEMAGWHYYMTPEDAARGILLMDQVGDYTEDCGGHENYSPLSTRTIFGKTQ